MKSEKDKMLSGELYLASDRVLNSERNRAKQLVYDYNNSKPDEDEKRNLIIREFLGYTSEEFNIEAPFHCDYGYNITIGEKFYSNFNLIILDCAKVTIGDNVLIGPNVGIYTATHPIDPNLRKQEYEFALPITIGNNVWIGGNVVINPGVTIGDNSVIGSGSVVTKDIPENVVAVGNPCRVVKKI